jgi:adenylate cyclase
LTREQRKLAAIVALDVVGYSRLMERDEAGTLARLTAHRRERLEPAVARNRGRLVKLIGDGVLLEFASAVDALTATIEFQRAMTEANSGRGDEPPIEFRVGVHVGDVIVDGDDLYGDGVNIAARLQELAEPGGILISGPVYDQVHNKLSIGFDCLGQQSLKNVANPVTGYRVLQGGGGPRPRPAVMREPAMPPHPAHDAQDGLSRAWAWYVGLPRLASVTIALAVFMFLINMFSGFHRVWFHWPAAVFLLIAIVWTVIRRKPS